MFKLLWAGSKSVGFGVTLTKFSFSNDKNIEFDSDKDSVFYTMFVVAKYDPPGNIIGQFKNNVMIKS